MSGNFYKLDKIESEKGITEKRFNQRRRRHGEPITVWEIKSPTKIKWASFGILEIDEHISCMSDIGGIIGGT